MKAISQPWRNATLLVAAIVAVIFRGFAEATDASSCAAVLCPVNTTCQNGQCKSICTPGYANCNGEWSDGCEVNIMNGDVENCGCCGAKCPKPKYYEYVSCEQGKCKYFDRCATIKCATFENSSTVCIKAKCRVTCNPGFANCNGILSRTDGCEVDLNNDVNNCGKCGLKCSKSWLKPYGAAARCSKGLCGH